jgi:signal transduction histidine kinase
MGNEFMPHGFCLQWNGPLLFLFIAGNIGIAAAYFLIPAALRIFVGKRKDLPYPYMFRLFAVFILSCGVSHLAKIWTIYHADYWMEASIDIFTALVSLLTAILLWPLIPKALQLRSPQELERANEDLARARDVAVQANILKSQFVANISHEIRTPMTAILGLSELLVYETEGETKETSQHIMTAAKSLMVLVNDLLDLSKLEAGRIDLNLEPFSVDQPAREVVGMFQATVAQKGLSLTTNINLDADYKAIGDAAKIKQVLQNLVQNAIKFTDTGTIQVNVGVETEDVIRKNIRFEVIDTGAGIAETDQSKLFQLFVQIDGSSTRRHGGTGLGLALSKRLIELMNGKIGVTSTVGKGSTFWFVVPLENVTA